MKLPGPESPFWRILESVVVYLPVLAIMAATTQDWDYEWWVVSALIGGERGRSVIENWRNRNTPIP